MIKVYIGYDSSNYGQEIAYRVCKRSIENYNNKVKIFPIKLKDLQKEYLKRFKYTFFIQHIGYSPYKGLGTSVQTSTAADTVRMGSAYKIYGCGLLYDRKVTQIEIIVPLESVVVIPY